jgi:excisionase family DNA binding protein
VNPKSIEREAPFVPVQMEYSPSEHRLRPKLLVQVRPVLQVMVFNAPEKAESEPVKAKPGKAEPETNGLMTAEQAAQYVGVHIETLRKWVRLGTFPRIPLPGGGKDFRFSKAMIDRWAEERALVPK